MMDEQFEEEEDIFQDLDDDDPADRLFKKLLAMNRLTGDADAMLEVIDPELRRHPGNHMLYILRGWVFQNDGRPDQALMEYNKALDINPDSAWANFRMGQSYADKDSHEKALSCLTRACELKPERPDFWIEKGEAEYNTDKIKDAFHSYDKAIKLGDKTGWAWFGKSRILIYLDMLDDALEAANNALNMDGENETFQKHIGFVKQKLHS